MPFDPLVIPKVVNSPAFQKQIHLTSGPKQLTAGTMAERRLTRYTGGSYE